MSKKQAIKPVSSETGKKLLWILINLLVPLLPIFIRIAVWTLSKSSTTAEPNFPPFDYLSLLDYFLVISILFLNTTLGRGVMVSVGEWIFRLVFLFFIIIVLVGYCGYLAENWKYPDWCIYPLLIILPILMILYRWRLYPICETVSGKHER